MKNNKDLYRKVTIKIRNSKKGLMSLTAELALKENLQKGFCDDLLEQLLNPNLEKSVINMFGEEICNDIRNLKSI